ncbi:MAG: alpha/beta fold hydrolase [Alphaproteobacteria bacterium]|nr:alpha/beta fold hydrolase [Alphaproteobacteria bacterium]
MNFKSKLFISIAGLYVMTTGTVKYIEFINTKINETYLSRFTRDDEVNAYKESAPQFYLPITSSPAVTPEKTASTKIPHATLVLHGFTVGPNNFHLLLDSMKQKQMPYYAPLLTGFGLQDFHISQHVVASDWLRDAVHAYDLLSEVADKVSIVGHSNGGVLACLLAQIRPVHKLVLISPNLAPCDDDKGTKKLLSTPIISTILKWAHPITRTNDRPRRTLYSDLSDLKEGEQAFSQTSISLQSLQALWTLQDQVDFKKIKTDSLFVLYGAQDLAVDTKAGLKKLNDSGLIYKTFVYSGSAHAPHVDSDRNRVNEDLIDILTDQN